MGDTSTGYAVPLVRRLHVRNYKSLGDCDLRLGPVSLIVGRNGAGKSNLVDALRFIADALRTTLEHSIRTRGGIDNVRRRSRGHPRHFQILVDIALEGDGEGSYGFVVGSRSNGGFEVTSEECRVYQPRLARAASFRVSCGALVGPPNVNLPARIEPDRLMLPVASTLPEFREVYENLSRMGFYNLNPEAIRALQDPDPGELLAGDGRNLAAVIRRMRDEDPDALDRVQDYLRAIVPGVTAIAPRSLGPKETIEFRQLASGDEQTWRFLAPSMSDGTLRVLGILVAVMQPEAKSARGMTRLVGVEEPEVAVHPGAAVKLMDALLEARARRQILITTHSPDLLEHASLDPDWVFVADMKGGETRITPMADGLKDLVRKHLYSIGELLRLDQLPPGPVQSELLSPAGQSSRPEETGSLQ